MSSQAGVLRHSEPHFFFSQHLDRKNLPYYPYCQTMKALYLTLISSLPLLAAQPNIILILADDLGYADLSCYGQETLATPNLDALAAKGMTFANHYCGNTVCGPSRAVLMTGQHSGINSIRGNGDGPLSDETPTLPRTLRQAGYKTLAIGKWGVGHLPSNDDPNRKGFDSFFGYVDMYHAHNLFPTFLIRDGEPVGLPNDLDAYWKTRSISGEGVSANRAAYGPQVLQNEVIKTLEAQSKDEPFFLYYALNIPHANNEGREAGMEVPDYGSHAQKNWPEPEKGFAKMIDLIDQWVGDIVTTLQQKGLAENTLLLFMSDNGPHQEGGHMADFFDSNGPLKGIKRDLTDGGIKTPLIAYWPGKVPVAKNVPHLSTFEDWLPTLADIAGADCPPTTGVSLAPTLLGKGRQEKRRYCYWEFERNAGKTFSALLQPPYKLILVNGESPEVYHLEDDPGEEKNLAASNPKILSELRSVIFKIRVNK